jgi:hypothetical protein
LRLTPKANGSVEGSVLCVLPDLEGYRLPECPSVTTISTEFGEESRIEHEDISRDSRRFEKLADNF